MSKVNHPDALISLRIQLLNIDRLVLRSLIDSTAVTQYYVISLIGKTLVFDCTGEYDYYFLLNKKGKDD